MITILLLAILLLSTKAMGQPGEIPLTKKSGNITYIDIGISQPDVEDCYEMTISDLQKEADWINIFPNPNPGQFTLEIHLQNAATSLYLQMYDLTGKIVFESRELPDGKRFRKDLDVNHLQKGVYFIRITGKDRVGVKQIIIN